jgi:autonomous glycyl radical cofactor GrcA
VNEAIMTTTGTHSSSVEVGISGWISIHINCEQSAIKLAPVKDGLESTERAAVIRPYEGSEDEIVPLPERFPRLTFLVVALALLFSSLTAELDFLRGAGYYQP